MISACIRVEQALQAHEQQRRASQRLARIATWEWDAPSEGLAFTEAYSLIYDLDPQERPPGYQEHLRCYTPESAARLDAAAARSMEAGEPFELDLELARRSGPPRWVTVRSEAVRDPGGRVVGLRGTVQDISARMRKEQQQTEPLRILTLELAQTEQRERKRLAHTLHDRLQQVLVGATFNLELLDGQITTPSGRQTIGKLSDTIQCAIQISRDLTRELCPPAWLGQGLAPSLEWLCRQARENHGLTVTLELEGTLEPDTEPVRGFIFEAVRELLFNVVKHARVDRALVCARTLDGRNLEITVEDRGAGFEAAWLDAGAVPAEGLGLLTIRERLRCLGGDLEVVSSPGQGSRFTMVVPIRSRVPASD
jgi:signal transduction histidine kinase